MNFNLLAIPVPIPVALAFVALIGYVFGRRTQPASERHAGPIAA